MKPRAADDNMRCYQRIRLEVKSPQPSAAALSETGGAHTQDKGMQNYMSPNIKRQLTPKIK